MLAWLDSEYGPTVAQASQARQAGYVAVGYYPVNPFPQTDAARAWSPAEMAACTQVGLVLVPILVPSPTLSLDPRAAAAWCYSALGRSVPILYDGPHLVDSGQIAGAVWVPQYGATPTGLAPGRAMQYRGSTDLNGWTVDLNLAADGFPLATGVAIDFEHNVAPGGWNTPQGRTAIAWYNTFCTYLQVAKAPPSIPPLPGRYDTVNIYTCPGKADYLVDGALVVAIDQPTVASLLNKPNSPSVWPVSPAVSDAIAAVAARA